MVAGSLKRTIAVIMAGPPWFCLSVSACLSLFVCFGLHRVKRVLRLAQVYRKLDLILEHDPAKWPSVFPELQNRTRVLHATMLRQETGTGHRHDADMHFRRGRRRQPLCGAA